MILKNIYFILIIKCSIVKKLWNTVMLNEFLKFTLDPLITHALKWLE